VSVRRQSTTFICSTDDRDCNCGAPKDTPGGMHPVTCSANPASRVIPERHRDGPNQGDAGMPDPNAPTFDRIADRDS
jgi:hypothetical protein